MIKLLQLSSDKQKKICDWLDAELSLALTDRSELESHWNKWQDNFEGKPEQEVKTFPFDKCSNLVIPTQAITVNAVISRQYNTLMSIHPFWTVSALSKSWTDSALPTQNLLEYAQKRELRMGVNLVDYFYDKSNMGTAFAKIPWIIEKRKDKIYADDGRVVAYEQDIADGPRFIPIPIQDFILPITSIQDIQKCQWVAHRFRLRFSTLKAREKAKLYINTEKVERFFNDQAEPLTSEQEKREFLQSSLEGKEHEIFEVWADYDYDDCGFEESVVFTYHKGANQLIRPILNPWKHRLRPFISSQCFPRPHRIYGIGYGQKLERLQEGITTAANQAIDNNSIANVKCFKAKKGKGIKPGQKLYTGKMFLLDELTDLEVFDLGTLNPYVLNIINFLRDVSEGISSYNVGKESNVVKSGATATSTLALIQEGTKQFDFMLNLDRLAMTETAYQVYSLYSQFKPNGFAYELLGEKEGEWIEKTWMANDGDVRRSLQFDLTASSAYVNQAVEREAWRMLSDVVIGFYSKLFEIAGVIFDPAAPPQLKVLVGKMAESGQLLMTRLLGQWNIKDIDRLIISQEDIATLVQSGVEANGPTQPQPTPGPQGVNRSPRMGGTPTPSSRSPSGAPLRRA